MTATAIQSTFDELGTPLRETTFVVVDLETTGGSPATSAITEVGAVRVRGGVVEGEFQTLVDPGAPIPPFIAVLTGITDGMVAGAPRVEEVVPAFLEFARGAVLVAHNARFDLSFLKEACRRTGHEWPAFDHLDTVTLARRVLTRDEARDVKLATLARLFRTTVAPCHRALADAQATTEVLHGLMERLGNLGVHSLEELRSFSSLVSPEQRRKRHLADALPHRPGVYLFRDASGRVLYVGKSKDLRARVRNYFVASEPRTRMAEMVGCAERVDHVECSHGLEAEVRELRLIAEHKPRYNRRSRFPERAVYLRLTTERFPRLSIVRKVGDGPHLGPFGSARNAELAMAAAHEAFRLRQCTMRITRSTTVAPCVLREMGRCGAPCHGEESEEEYAAHVRAFTTAVTSDPGAVHQAVQRRMAALAAQRRYEDAAGHRDRLAAFVRAAARGQQLTSLARVAQLVAAQPDTRGGWHVCVVRHGRLVAAGAVPVGIDPRPHVDALVASAETVATPPGPGPTPCATSEEMQAILRWLAVPGTRLVRLDGEWASPSSGAARLLSLFEDAYEPAGAFTDRRPLRTADRPARMYA